MFKTYIFSFLLCLGYNFTFKEECNKVLEGIASSMSEAFRVCDLEMAPYYETAREFCDIDGGTVPGGGVGGGGTTGDGANNELAPGKLM